MTEDVFIIAIVFGTGAMITFVAMFYSLVKTWIKSRNNSSLSDEQIQALQYDYEELKKSVEKRLQNLEAIVADEDLTELDKALETNKQKEKKKKPDRLPKQTEQKKALDEIEYSNDNDENDKETENHKESGRSSNLNNMLQNS